MRTAIVSEDVRFVGWIQRAMTSAGWTSRWVRDTAARELVWADGGVTNLVVTDLRLAELRGEAGRRLVAGPGRLVVVAPEWDDHTHEASLCAGADAFVALPVGTHELIARLRSVVRRDLERAVPRGRTRFEVGALSVDLDVNSVVVGAESLALRPVEQSVLVLLVELSPRVVAHARLEAEVRAVDGPSARLDPTLRRLRSRLEEAEGWRRIEAVRGVGYRLLAHPPSGDRRPTFTAVSGDGQQAFDRHRERVEP